MSHNKEETQIFKIPLPPKVEFFPKKAANQQLAELEKALKRIKKATKKTKAKIKTADSQNLPSLKQTHQLQKASKSEIREKISSLKIKLNL